MSGDEDDREAFAAAMRGVKRLRDVPRVGRAPSPKSSTPKLPRRTPSPSVQRPSAPQAAPAAAAAGLKAMRRQLRRGELSVGAELDLHGATAAQAPTLLHAFLAECRMHGVRCARVIHGKGRRSGPDGPVLKGVAHDLLARSPEVLGFTAAEPRDGGSGAVLVLLRD